MSSKQNQWYSGLSVRAANGLLAHDISSVAGLRRFLDEGHPLHGIPNIGYALENEILDWLSTQQPTAPKEIEEMSNKVKAQKAADALTDLNMLYAIKYLCENSLFRTPAGDLVAAKISKLCTNAAQQQLEVYDKNMEAITP